MLRGIIPTNGGGGDVTALTARVTTLENIQYEYEVFTSIASGTSATITFPAGSALVVGEYAGQNALVTVLDASGRPIDQAAKTAAGAVITTTLNAGGTYTLSGTPSAYPVGLVYQLRCSAKNAGNIALASIIDATQIEGTMAKQDANAVAITGGTASLSSLTLSSGTADGVLYLNGSKAATSGSALTFNGATLNFGGTTQRFTADTTGATINDRFAFVTNQANSTTRFNVAPSGTGTASSLNVFNNSNLNNASVGALISTDTAITLSSGITGAGSYLPLLFSTNGAERARIDTSGNFGIGSSSPVYKFVVSNAGAQGFEFDPATGITQVFNRNTAAYGEWLQYASQVRFFTGASPTEKVRIDASGNLGIGTASPGARLDVRGNATFSGNGTARQTADFTNTGGQLYIGTESSAGGAVFSGSSAYAGVVGTNLNTPLQLATNGSVKATIDTTGNLGVGTSIPLTKIDARGSSGLGIQFIETTTGNTNRIQLGATSGVSYINADAGIGTTAMAFQVATSERMRLDSSGNLGIGTSSPIAKLHVNGGIARVQAISDGNDGILRVTDTAVSTQVQTYATASAGWFGVVENKPLAFLTNNLERMRLDSSGNLGIGATPNTSKVVAAGVIESTSGGFKFPDGTTQTTAATGGGGGGVTVKTSTITVSSATYYQYTTSIVDATVSAASHINAWLAPNTDWDGDDLIDYYVIVTPKSGTIDVCISAPGPIVGTFTLKYFVA